MSADAAAVAGALQVRWTNVDDPVAAPVLADLSRRYTELYGDDARREMDRYGMADFAAPDGGLLVLVADDGAVAAGALRRYDATTAEFKRMWTRADHRRRGLARRVLAELESGALDRGYTSVYLTTGSRQQDAAQLYVATGYTPHFDRSLLTAAPEQFRELPFTKQLGTDVHSGPTSRVPLTGSRYCRHGE